MSHFLQIPTLNYIFRLYGLRSPSLSTEREGSTARSHEAATKGIRRNKSKVDQLGAVKETV